MILSMKTRQPETRQVGVFVPDNSFADYYIYRVRLEHQKGLHLGRLWPYTTKLVLAVKAKRSSLFKVLMLDQDTITKDSLIIPEFVSF
jgi:hypothetical protein